MNPADPPVASGQDDGGEGARAIFEQARANQSLVLEQASRLLAAGENIAIPDLEAGLVALNRSILQSRMAITILRKQDTDDARALLLELREENAKVMAAFNELLTQHPDPEALPAQVLEDNASQ